MTTNLVSFDDSVLDSSNAKTFHALRIDAQGRLTHQTIFPTDTALIFPPPNNPLSAHDPRLVVWTTRPLVFSIATNGHLRMTLS